MSEFMIELRNVTKRYGPIVANDHINLQVRRGELLTLLGPSGCGKTTALRCITGYVTPDEGRVFIDGKDVTDLPTHQRELGMVFQNFALFPHMTVFQNVEFPLRIRNVPRDQREQMVREALELVRLTGYEDHYPRQLSGGQQQRVGLARALVYRPKVLLLDEPLSNLDAKLREEMRFEIRDLQRRLGITALYVTHDQEEALALSDRLAIMHRGRIEQVGTPEEVYEHPRSRFVAEFIGLSDFIEAEMVGVAETGQMEVAANGLRLRVPQMDGVRPGQRLLVFVRPNEIELLAQPPGDGVNVFPGIVEKVTYLGDKIDYRVRVGNLMLRVQTDSAERFAPQARVAVRLPAERCKVILES